MLMGTHFRVNGAQPDIGAHPAAGRGRLPPLGALGGYQISLRLMTREAVILKVVRPTPFPARDSSAGSVRTVPRDPLG